MSFKRHNYFFFSFTRRWAVSVPHGKAWILVKSRCWSCGTIHRGREVIWKVWDSRRVSKETKWSLSALTTASFWIFWRCSLETLTDAAKYNNACSEIVTTHSINFPWEANARGITEVRTGLVTWPSCDDWDAIDVNLFSAHFQDILFIQC